MFFTHIAQFVRLFLCHPLRTKVIVFPVFHIICSAQVQKKSPSPAGEGETPYSANSRIARIWQIEPRITKTWNTQCMNGFSLPLPYRIAPIV